MAQVHHAALRHTRWLWMVLVLVATTVSSASLAAGGLASYAYDSGPRGAHSVVARVQDTASGQDIRQDTTSPQPSMHGYDDRVNLAHAFARLDAYRSAPSSSGRTVISGHGSYSPSSGTLRVPQGTTVRTYAPHGASITDELGNAIETGTHANRIAYSRTFGPGSELPNYTVHPPTGLSIRGNPITVSSPTRLSDLLRPGMGECHLAFCFHQPGHALEDAYMQLLP